MEDNNKKTLVLSILGVLVLVIAVVGVSFAMYSFSATGETENVITTGSVSVAYEKESVITLDNQYPMADALGIAQTDEGSILTFDVTSKVNGSINIKYDLALSDIAYTDANGATTTALGDGDIKFVLTKKVDTGAESYIKGTAEEGVTFADVKANTGNGYINSYVIDSGTFTESSTAHYTLKAWLNKDYRLPGQVDGNVAGVENTNDNTIDHTNTTDIVKVTFKVKVEARQA